MNEYVEFAYESALADLNVVLYLHHFRYVAGENLEGSVMKWSKQLVIEFANEDGFPIIREAGIPILGDLHYAICDRLTQSAIVRLIRSENEDDDNSYPSSPIRE